MPWGSLLTASHRGGGEALDDRLVHKEDLERRAALTVKRQRALDALRNRRRQIGIRKNHRGILGVQAQDAAQAMQPRVSPLIASAAFELPMKASTSICPVCMSGGMISLPWPLTMLTTPGEGFGERL